MTSNEEAIFEECAEIAMEHVGQCPTGGGGGWESARTLGYNNACRDIAEAIKLRASNRKIMDAIVDAALLKP